MAKRTHHTNHNQNRKDHRHGIRRPKWHSLVDTPGVSISRLRNTFYSKLGMKRAAENSKN